MDRTSISYSQININNASTGAARCLSFNGKEKDYESGFHYYGARYYWSESLTGWLSVDPMADKYPNMSPYNYCAWNPVVSIDPKGTDSVKIDLTSGSISHIKSEGDHCIQYYRDNELIKSSLINSSECKMASFSHEGIYKEDETQFNSKTNYLRFSNASIGEDVFHTISALGSEKEWDYYNMKHKYGELSSSMMENKMVHLKNRYTFETASKWDHYHPGNISESYYPSHSDQTHARELGIPCFIYSQSKSMRFDNLIPIKGFISVTQFGRQWRTFAR